MRICQHEYPTLNSVCLHCGRGPVDSTHACVFREVPRAKPPSFMSGDCTSIGDEGRAIAAREWQPDGKSE